MNRREFFRFTGGLAGLALLPTIPLPSDASVKRAAILGSAEFLVDEFDCGYSFAVAIKHGNKRHALAAIGCEQTPELVAAMKQRLVDWAMVH